MRPSARGALALALALALPSVARAQVALGTPAQPGGTVLGRVCLDLDGDGRCGPGEPGVAGARVMGEGGAVARADAAGLFHLLELPGRLVETDRTAYGGHALAAEGLGVTRAFELPPGGAAQVDLPVPAPAAFRAPELTAEGVAGPPPSRGADGRLRWGLAGRTEPDARVAVGGAEVRAGPDGAFAVEVALVEGENHLSVAVTTDGALALFRWTVHLVPRARGGALLVPGAPEPLGAVAVVPDRSGGVLVSGALAPGVALRAGGLLAGSGRVAAWAPRGEPVELVDGSGAALGRATLPEPRDGSTAVGLAELELSVFGTPSPLFTGRGAGAARGRTGQIDWELGIDVDERDRHDAANLVRPRDSLVAQHALDPSRTFAATGDEAAADDRNAPRGRVWGRAETEDGRLEVGSTRASAGPGELGRYDRSIFGGRVEAKGALGPVRVEGAAFGATLRADSGGNGPPTPAHDVLRATGGMALWLSHGEVVPGSESLRIEARDPLTGRIAWGRPLIRAVDYEIEWESGRVALAVPLASVAPPAAVLTGDPFAAPAVAVIADYLFAAAATPDDDVAGGRAGVALGPVSLSARAASEERGGGDAWRLAGAGAALDLGPALNVRADVARTHGLLFGRGGGEAFARSDDGMTFVSPAAPSRTADAVHLEASGGGGPVRAEGWWRERQAGYSDAEFLEAISARERGATVTAGGAAGPSGLVRLAERRGADPRDPTGLAPLDQKQLLARGAWQGSRLGLAIEGVRLEQDGEFADGSATSAGARASWRFDPSLAVDVAHHQKLELGGDARDPTFTSAGATWSQGASSLGVRGGWGPALGPRLLVSGARSAPGEAVYGTFGADPDAPDVLGGPAATLGVRQRTGAAEVFTEERYGQDLFGIRQTRVLGVTVRPLRGLVLSLSGENGERLRLDDSVVRHSAVAASAGLVRGPVRLAARGEVRDEGGDGHAAAGGSAEWMLAPGRSLAARISWMHGRSAGVEGLGLDASVAGAWRADRAGGLVSAARFVEQRPGQLRREGVALRLAVTADAGARVKGGVAAGVAWQEVAGASDDRVAGSARMQVRIAGPVDAAVEYARRAPLSGGSIGALDAGRVEAGLVSGEARVALGFLLVGFGGDGLTPASDTGRLYLRAQVAY
jgi:hypothetical protein